MTAESKPLNLAPFTGVHHTLHEIMEKLLGDIHRSGEWDDDHQRYLDAWRLARGDDAKDAWWWWVGEAGADDYHFAQDAPTRDEAIAIGRREYVGQGRFIIIEARMWRDTVKDGDEVSPFAESRNPEVFLIAPAVQAGEAA